MTDNGAAWATLIFMIIMIGYGIYLAIKEAIFGPPKPMAWSYEQWENWKDAQKKETEKAESQPND